jgi:hypothetical protein
VITDLGKSLDPTTAPGEGRSFVIHFQPNGFRGKRTHKEVTTDGSAGRAVSFWFLWGAVAVGGRVSKVAFKTILREL